MTCIPSVPFWVLLVLGTSQAALAASVLTDARWVWYAAAIGYAAALVSWARRPWMTARLLIALAYLLPLLVYVVMYTAVTLPDRPEVAEARALSQPPAADPPPPPAAADPTPRFHPPRGNWGVARSVWLVGSTAVVVAARALAGLFWHTPVVVYLLALVAGVLAIRRPEGLR